MTPYEAPEGRVFLAFTTATGLSRSTEISWPKGKVPTTDKTVRTGQSGRLPRADVLVVTWTVDEGHALSPVLTPVLTPGKDSRDDYRPYRRNFAKIAKKMRAGVPRGTPVGLGDACEMGAPSLVSLPTR